MEDRVSAALLDWYDGHGRTLPWRVRPGGERPDPYRVWLSEIMLQQTTTAHAAPYYGRFTERWPTVEALASAPEEAIMTEWAGLGYYSRARNLVACARAVADRGGFPDTEAELRQLPGLGAYTAAIAFGRRAVVIDANVERGVARLFAIDTPLPGARKAIREAADTITPAERSGDFAQAMMDLGATICTARNPRCLLCPLSTLCAARAQGRQGELPVKAAKRAKPLREGTTFWIERPDDGGRKVWLVRRPARGMLGGMRALPDDGWSARSHGSGDAPLPGAWRAGGVVRHGFTHFDLELGLAIYAGDSWDGLDGGEWWPVEDLDEAGLPTLFAKAARLATAVG
jgi:A/G-specific adenine glycosylase